MVYINISNICNMNYYCLPYFTTIYIYTCTYPYHIHYNLSYKYTNTHTIYTRYIIYYIALLQQHDKKYKKIIDKRFEVMDR